MIVAILFFALSAACMAILYCQAILRHVTLRRHLRDAFGAALRGESPPRAVWPRPRADWDRIRMLERETGVEPWQ